MWKLAYLGKYLFAKIVDCALEYLWWVLNSKLGQSNLENEKSKVLKS